MASRDLRPAVFLDRDGVLNAPIVRQGRPFPPPTPDEFRVLPGVSETCRQLHRAGFMLVVVTNQPDVARGTTELAVVEEIHDRLRDQLEVDALYLCPHDDADECACRKSKPGLLLDAASDLELDLERSYLVGDRWRDIEAGKRAGCRTVYVDRGYLEEPALGANIVVGSLPEAGRYILTNCERVEGA